MRMCDVCLNQQFKWLKMRVTVVWWTWVELVLLSVIRDLAVSQARPNFAQTTPRGNIGTPTGPSPALSSSDHQLIVDGYSPSELFTAQIDLWIWVEWVGVS